MTTLVHLVYEPRTGKVCCKAMIDPNPQLIPNANQYVCLTLNMYNFAFNTS